MRLKNIEMQGFKSFADKIYLDFNSGITAISSARTAQERAIFPMPFAGLWASRASNPFAEAVWMLCVAGHTRSARLSGFARGCPYARQHGRILFRSTFPR